MIMAIDQQAMDEHVRATDDLDNVDDFMGRLFRGGSQGREPLIHSNTSKRCDISMTRPTTIPGVSYIVSVHACDTVVEYYFPIIRTTQKSCSEQET